MMDTSVVKQIIEIFDNSDVSVMELEIADMKIKLKKPEASSSAVVTVTPAKTETAVKEEPEEKKTTIDSPLVGTFYSAVKPDEKPYVEIGDFVKKGDVVCIVEAMKSINEIKSDKDGTIVEILVNNGDFVEFGQPLFVIGENR